MSQSRLAGLGLATLMFVQLGFWIGAWQAGEIAGALVDASRLRWIVLTSTLALAPAIAGVWALLRRLRLEPSPIAKLGLAYVGLALGCTALATAIEFSRAGSLPSELVIVGAVLLGAAAAVAGLATITAVLELAPRRRVAALSAWALTLVLARSLAGWTEVPARSSEALFDACLAIGFVAVGIAVLSSLLWHADDDDHAPLGHDLAPRAARFALRSRARVRAHERV